MKNTSFILILLVCPCVGLHSEDAQQKIFVEKVSSAVTAERQALVRDCQKITAEVTEPYAGLGMLRSSGFQLTIKKYITGYLTSRGTPTALQLLGEYEQHWAANDWWWSP